MTTKYWRDVSPPDSNVRPGRWTNTDGNWRNAITGGTTQAPPGANDLAVFNSNDIAGTECYVYLNNPTTSVSGLVFNGNSSGGLYLYGGNDEVSANQTLTIGANGVFVTDSAPVIDYTAWLTIGANQPWSVASGSALDIYSPIIGSSAYTITSSGAGAVTLGTNNSTFLGNWQLNAGTYFPRSNSCFGTGTVSVASGVWLSTIAFGGVVTHIFANAWNIDGSIKLGTASTGGGNFRTWYKWDGNVNIRSNSTFDIQTVQNDNSFDLIVAGALNSPSAVSLTLSGPTTFSSDVSLLGSAGTFGGTISVGTNRRLVLGASGSGSPNQINAASQVAGTGSLLVRGSTAYTVPFSVAESVAITVENPDITFPSAGISASGDFFLSAVTANGLTQTQRVRFNNAASFGTAASYRYNTAAATWTNLKQIIEYAGNVDRTQTKTLFLTNSVNSGSVYVASLKNSSASLLTQQGNITYARATVATTFDVDTASGPITVSGAIQQTGTGVLSVTKTGTNAATLSGANTFLGSFSLTQGSVDATSATALGAATSTNPVSVAAGTTLTFSAAASYASRNLALSGSTLVLGHAGGTTTFLGVTANTAATTFRGTASGALAATNGITCGAFRPTFSATAGNSITVASAITGSGGLRVGVVGDMGTVVLGANNSALSGTTALDYGTLRCTNADALISTGLQQAASTVLQTTETNGRLHLGGVYTNAGGTLRIGGM